MPLTSIGRLTRTPLPAVIMIALGVGCTARRDIEVTLTERMYGTIGGADWTFAYGYTDPEAAIPEGQKHMIVLLPTRPPKGVGCPQDKTPLADSRTVLFTIKGKTGAIPVGEMAKKMSSNEFGIDGTEFERVDSGMLGFSVGNHPRRVMSLARTGLIRVDRITPKFITGRLFARAADDTTYVNGSFWARVCQYGQIK